MNQNLVMPAPTTFSLTTTMGELPSWGIQLELTGTGNQLLQLLEREPSLPGVILTQSGHYHGLVSRRRLLELMSRPYSQEIFRHRSLAVLYRFVAVEVLVVAAETTILHATHQALQRASGLVYEPLLVQFDADTYRVVDFHQVLLAQVQIPALALQHAQQTEQAAQTVQAEFSALRQNYAQYLQTEKMASLGQLVAGLAHEINNPVNFIYGNLKYVEDYAQDLLHLVQLYQTHYPQPVAAIQAATTESDLEFLLADLPKLLESMKVGTERIRQLVLSLRHFSRLDEAAVKAVDIHEGIESTLLLLEHRLKATPQRAAITVVKAYGRLPPVQCYPGPLNQVWMNLLANAVDAVEEASTLAQAQGLPDRLGTITVRTFMDADEQVHIDMTDNGLGIPVDVQTRIFDPFFTTKVVGQGTGLGLSISYQIVTQKHGGTLTFTSSPEAGTTFSVQLPLHGVGTLQQHNLLNEMI